MTIRFRVLLMLAFALVLAATGCHTPPKKKKNPTPPNQMPDQSGDVAFQAFIGRLRAAVGAHDLAALAPMMTPDFGYHIDPDMQGDGVFQYWDQNNVWPDLNAVLQQKFVPAGNFMVAPPAFATDPDYHGYRVGIGLVNGSWKFAYFVKD
ncbi:MAG TPA: hypothetical protein VG733_01810 [Chthoniobacteraceae bacterium]|nr:hypothetical protein [Chthoniobacteraceae bacterium]